MDPSYLDKAAYWVNLAYIATVCLTLIATVVVVFISYQRAAVRDVELKKVQADAARQVATANQLSAQASEHAASANAAASEAQSEAANATLAQEKLRKENLQLSIQLEQEKRLRLEVQERLAQQPSPGKVIGQNGQPRVLTNQQEQALASTMRSFSDRRVAVIEIGDGEAGPLARQISAALSSGSWSVSVSRLGALVPPQYGIICTHGPADRAAAALVETLRSFDLTVYERNANGNSQFEILVGLKPV
jgi:hypothetical protein